MSDTYFSDREFGERPRDVQEITPDAWQGIVGAINSRVDAGAFGLDFPQRCEDGPALIIGNDETTLAQAIRGEIALEWPLRIVTSTESTSMFPSYQTEPYAPPTAIVLDLIEFCWRYVAQPNAREPIHGYYGHAHLDFDRTAGRAAFAEQINRIFARKGLTYELRDSGRVERLAPPVLRDILRSAVFRTGDDVLDGLLETARHKFLSHDPNTRRESLEKLWDAWERLKTLDTPSDKRLSIQNLLDQVTSEPTYRSLLETEARTLTNSIGNAFQIRHHEIGKAPVSDDSQVDYFFHRLFALMLLILGRNIASDGE
jgi:hypothetical protein